MKKKSINDDERINCLLRRPEKMIKFKDKKKLIKINIANRPATTKATIIV